MKPLMFKQAEYLLSTLDPLAMAPVRSTSGMVLPELAIAGRSNVGKSSLINHLLGQKALARVSATPGKTRTINLFKVDDAVAIADLPGYGYAKIAKDMKEKWGEALDLYLNKRENLQLILLLLDSRREPTGEDLQFFEWAKHHKKPLLCIFTKSDKLSQEDLRRPGLYYSIKDKNARKKLINTINELLHGNVR